MINLKLHRGTVEFDDLSYMERTSEKILIMILEDASGNRQNFINCLQSDIRQCAAYLINNGFVRGTTFSNQEMCWSKITRKGEFLLEYLK